MDPFQGCSFCLALLFLIQPTGPLCFAVGRLQTDLWEVRKKVLSWDLKLWGVVENLAQCLCCCSPKTNHRNSPAKFLRAKLLWPFGRLDLSLLLCGEHCLPARCPVLAEAGSGTPAGPRCCAMSAMCLEIKAAFLPLPDIWN